MMTGPSITPTSSSRLYAVSISSLMGVSSGSVASMTRVRVGSPSMARASVAWLCNAPLVAASAMPVALRRNVMA